MTTLNASIKSALMDALHDHALTIERLRVAGNNLLLPANVLLEYCEKGNTICFDNYSSDEDVERYAGYINAWVAALAPEVKS